MNGYYTTIYAVIIIYIISEVAACPAQVYNTFVISGYHFDTMTTYQTFCYEFDHPKLPHFLSMKLQISPAMLSKFVKLLAQKK